MARVPLIQEQDHPELAEVIEKYRSGRRGKLINMYRMLLNAPALAESWFNHSNTVRWKTSLDGRLREVVIIRMGHLTGAQYVLRQHVPSLAAAEGLTREECDALADWRASKFFTERERAALAWTEAVTLVSETHVPDDVYEQARKQFSEQELANLTLAIIAINGWNRLAISFRTVPGTYQPRKVE